MPALYATLTVTLVITVAVVASVVRPATPPSIAELGPAPQERIEQAREDQAAGTAPGATGPNGADRQGPGPPTAAPAGPEAPTVAPPAPPTVEVPATRRCFGDPPRQTEDPHSPPCVFEIFTGDNGGATAPGVTTTEIRVAVPTDDGQPDPVTQPLIDHFNRRYELYGRRLTPVFVETGNPGEDPVANHAAAEALIAAKPFAVVSGFSWATNAIIHRRLADEGVVSIVSRQGPGSDFSGAPGFDVDDVVDGFTWLVDPPLDVRLRAGAGFVCAALNGRRASHAGPEYTDDLRTFAVVVETEPSGPDHRPLADGLEGCDATFDVFPIATNASDDERRDLMLGLKLNPYTTILHVASVYPFWLLQWAERLSYFPEWVNFGSNSSHREAAWSAPQLSGQARHAFGLTPDVRIRPDSEVPAMWALRESDPNLDSAQRFAEGRYETLLVLASGIQGVGPNLTAETFARALRAMRFPNPNPGRAPHWQQRVGFGSGDVWFHDDYAIWWWNETAPSQTVTPSGRGSFCYLDRGGRFTPESFPADADTRLFDPEEPCR